MESVSRKAYGKINIALDVTGRRADGYHLVRMIMQTVGIYDVVNVTKKAAPGEIVITSNLPEVPRGQDNIAWRAARMVFDAYGISDGIGIHIEKNIPMAAGMAGGSTDGAAVILGLNELYDLNMSGSEMDAFALKLGADVPFCLRTGTWLSEGIGEILTRIEGMPEAGVLIVNPGAEVSTAGVYRAFDSLADPVHPDIDAAAACISEGRLDRIAASMGNILENVTEPRFPVIADIKAQMMRRGALGSIMTGSGPTVFGLFADRDAAQEALEFFRADSAYGRCFLTGFIM